MLGLNPGLMGCVCGNVLSALVVPGRGGDGRGAPHDLMATLPEIAVRQYAVDGDVRILPPPFKFEPIQILMSWHSSKSSEPALRWSRKLVRTTAKRVAADQHAGGL